MLIGNVLSLSYLGVILMLSSSCWPTLQKAEAPDACVDRDALGQSLDSILVLSKHRAPIFSTRSAAIGRNALGTSWTGTTGVSWKAWRPALQEKHHSTGHLHIPSLSHMLSSKQALSPAWPAAPHEALHFLQSLFLPFPRVRRVPMCTGGCGLNGSLHQVKQKPL